MSTRKRRALSAMNTIDMTPLVDLTFILLIVFIVAAPALEYAVEVSPPALDAAKISKDDSIIISINSEGQYFLGSDMFSNSELRHRLAAFKNLKKTFYVRADEVRPYGEVIALMRLLRESGITNVSLVTDAEK